jgi:dipeptide/tripeptide permease
MVLLIILLAGIIIGGIFFYCCQRCKNQYQVPKDSTVLPSASSTIESIESTVVEATIVQPVIVRPQVEAVEAVEACPYHPAKDEPLKDYFSIY